MNKRETDQQKDWYRENGGERKKSEGAKENVKFIISSDAHSPERVGTYEGGLLRAFRAGLDPERIVNIKRI